MQSVSMRISDSKHRVWPIGCAEKEHTICRVWPRDMAEKQHVICRVLADRHGQKRTCDF